MGSGFEDRDAYAPIEAARDGIFVGKEGQVGAEAGGLEAVRGEAGALDEVLPNDLGPVGGEDAVVLRALVRERGVVGVAFYEDAGAGRKAPQARGEAAQAVEAAWQGRRVARAEVDHLQRLAPQLARQLLPAQELEDVTVPEPVLFEIEPVNRTCVTSLTPAPVDV